MNDPFDIVIVGGGFVGYCAALALAKFNNTLKIALVESMIQSQESLHAIALNARSCAILMELGIDLSVAHPIKSVHVSQQGRFSALRIHAKELNVPELGRVILAHHLLRLLHERLQTHVSILNGTLVGLTKQEGWQIRCQAQEIVTLNAKLLIAADGSDSKIRHALSIPIHQDHARYDAIVCHTQVSGDLNRVAYQRFTSRGILALIPLDQHRAAMVWTGSKISDLMTQTDSDFLRQLQHYFGYRVGRFLSVTPRQRRSLKTFYAPQQFKKDLVLLGNSAHTLLPIAAQGFNLALCDLASLMALIVENFDQHRNLGSNLERYASSRINPQRNLLRFTNCLPKLFACDFMPINALRSAGLFALDAIPIFKKNFAQWLMGFA
jgi:2-octaprenyl-6-methoxyphenol hydroxylase